MATIGSKHKHFFNSIVVSKTTSTFLLAARVLILPLLVTTAQAGEVNLAWNPSISSSVGGYRVYYGQISNSYTTSQDVGNKFTYTAKDLQNGAVYYFAVTAYDLTKTVESDFSNEVSSLVENTYSLTVGKTGTGTGTVTGAGISCGTDCSEIYTAGTIVTLTAAATTGSIFSGWDGDCFGTAATCLLAMSAVRNLTATFNSASASTFALTVGKTGTGTGTVTGAGISCGTDCSEIYTAGTIVTLTAVAATGSIFGGWDGDCFGTAATCLLAMSAVRNLTATFNSASASTFALTVGRAGTGSGTVTGAGISCGTDCSEIYTAGTIVTLTAAATTGSIFSGWSGSCLGVEACYLTMSAARSVVATFQLRTPKRTQTVGLYAPATGIFFLRNSHAGGAADFTFRYGPAGSDWIPLVGDWDGDGIQTVGLYAPATGIFFLRNSHAGGAADFTFRYGPAGSDWIPLMGDWDGDGIQTVGLYAPATGIFFLRNSHAGGAADFTFRYGPAGSDWIPLVGDWDGDGIQTVGLYAPATGIFFLRNSHAGGAADFTFRYGPTGSDWIPLVGDWDGDGIQTVGLYAPATGIFFLRNSHAGGAADFTFRYGPAGSDWIPLVGDWDGLNQ